MYGAALYRLRPGDFQELKHVDGISPSWPLGYDDFEPWYTRAEWLYQVHGAHGEDPIEGHWSRQYPWPAVSNEPRMQQLFDDLVAGGYHPFHAPCGILLDEKRRPASTCIWCNLERGRLLALVGGNSRYGGLVDLCGIGQTDARENVVARFAVIRRARLGARPAT